MPINIFIFENRVVHGMNVRNTEIKETYKILWQTKHNIAPHKWFVSQVIRTKISMSYLRKKVKTE